MGEPRDCWRDWLQAYGLEESDTVQAESAAVIHCGDVLAVLQRMESGSVHCVVTSPPYYGLRSYGTPPQIWGGLPDCAHDWTSGGRIGGGKQPGEKVRWQHTGAGPSGHGHTEDAICSLCGAWRGHLGQEPLHDCLAWARGEPPCPVCYVCHLRTVFAEVRRVLREDGTCWLNLGDSFTSGGRANYDSGAKRRARDDEPHPLAAQSRLDTPPGLKPKDLCMIPARVALALQADGWWLRRDVIWFKVDPIPESTPDRPTSAHEFVYFLAKSGRTRSESPSRVKTHGACTCLQVKVDHFATMPEALVEPCVLAGCPEGGLVLDPFAGSGTAGVVAIRHGRRFVGIDLNPVYCQMARARIDTVAPLFVEPPRIVVAPDAQAELFDRAGAP